jgi:NADPH:quinone reductase-like Zn-dependent oxidoreductase
MRAAWYERRGPARDVLVVGDLPDPQPGPGEVGIRVSASGINPGDVGERSGRPGAPMPYPRVIAHSDGAGVIDAVGPGVDGQRVGQPVWCYGAQRLARPEREAVPRPMRLTRTVCPGALSPARVAAHSRAMAKAGRNQHMHGCPWKIGSAVLRSRESP